VDTTTALSIGHESDGSTQFRGSLAHLAVYKSVLSAAQVAAHYAAATGTGGNDYKSAWHYTYDAMGRQTTTVPPVNGGGATALDTTETVYDAGGRVARACSEPVGATACTDTSAATRVAITDPTTGYDHLGRVHISTIANPAAGGDVITTTTIYGTDGSLTSTDVTSANAATSGIAVGPTDTANHDLVTYGYDKLGRPITIDRGSGTGTRQTTMTYVDTGYLGYGALYTRKDDAATGDTTTMVYDWAGHETSVASAAGTVTQAWRLDGLLAARTLPTSPAETDSVTYDHKQDHLPNLHPRGLGPDRRSRPRQQWLRPHRHRHVRLRRPGAPRGRIRPRDRSDRHPELHLRRRRQPDPEDRWRRDHRLHVRPQ
jgi:hypothetical protein